MLIAGFVMMSFVVPQLTSVLVENGGQMPLPTAILIAVSGFFAAYWWAVAFVIVAGVAALIWYASTGPGKRFFDLLSLRLPIFGGIFQRLAVVRMVRSMKTLLDGGVDAVTALEVTSDVVGNEIYREIINKTIIEVRDGRPLSTVFLKYPKTVPPMVSQMFSVGEETGKLSEILERLGNFYSREIDNLVGGLVTLIEPVIILIIGAAVGLMVAAIILPMYSLSSSL
jgi:type II secretory pathway component PulF